MQIEANLSIEKCGGAENLKVVIAAVEKELKKKYPNAQISVRKGFFQTIDGIWSDDSKVENEVYFIVNEVRDKVLGQ